MKRERDMRKKQKETNQNIVSQRVERLLKKLSSVADERFTAVTDDDLVQSCAAILRPTEPHHQRSANFEVDDFIPGNVTSPQPAKRPTPPLPRMPEDISQSLRPNYVPRQPIKKLSPHLTGCLAPKPHTQGQVWG